jgi:cephalosporin hydroxylase
MPTQKPMEMRTNQLPPEAWKIVDQFHHLIYGRAPLWRGWPILKCPSDLWLYQELLWRVQPDTLIECGTGFGGSTLYFANLMDGLGKGQVISIDQVTDIDYIYAWAYACNTLPRDPLPAHTRPEHPRITYLTGGTTAKTIMRTVERLTHGTTLVVLDSAHNKRHVLQECRLYGPLVTVGSYLVVEDTNINGHPLSWDGDDYPGPYEAAMAFLKQRPAFKWDLTATEKYLMSYNAWLIRMEQDQ